MMTPRQAAFRADYRTRISPWYSGLGHVLVIAALGLATIWYCARNVHQPTLLEWLVVPVVFVGCNIFEWAMHRFIMHRPVKGLMGIYKRHVLAHHQFFTDHEPTIDNTRDFRITFFPPYALTTFICMSAAGGLVLAALWSVNAGYFLVATTSAAYLNYELFHWGCHVKDDRIVRHIPFMNTIRRHHIAHHNPAIMMGTNFNLTYPFADWLFATTDLDRGVWGHLINGYDTRFKKPNLKKARATAGDSRLAAAE
jgi:hypothetical protein